MTLTDLHINGKRVTPRNASRFVKARYPSARIHSESTGHWSRHSRIWIVKGGIDGHGNTAGEAWLYAAHRMVENDAKEAARKSALAAVSDALSRAAVPGREAAALLYAAERLRQHTDSYRVREAIPILETMAAACSPGSGENK